MRIAHVLSHVDSIHAGVPIATRKLGHALVSLGVNVSFWATGAPEEADSLAAAGIEPHIFKRKWPEGWRYSPELYWALKQNCHNIDMIHIHEVWNYPQFAAARVAIRHNIPYIWAPRASLEPWRMRYKGWKKCWYFRLFGKKIMDNAACMHAVSAAEVDGFRMLGYRGPSIVVNNGIDPAEFTDLPAPYEAEQVWPALVNKRIVLFLSRISPEKGIDSLLSAWSSLVLDSGFPKSLLVLAGPDDRGYRTTVEHIVKQRGLSNHVLMTGMVSGRDKLALISRADLYVLPSYSEGFSNSILENLAASKPVLISQGCNFPEVEKAGAGLCIEPTREHLMSSLKRMLNMSTAELEKMGECGRKMVMEKYTWEIAANKLIRIYQSVIDG